MARLETKHPPCWPRCVTVCSFLFSVFCLLSSMCCSLYSFLTLYNTAVRMLVGCLTLSSVTLSSYQVHGLDQVGWADNHRRPAGDRGPHWCTARERPSCWPAGRRSVLARPAGDRGRPDDRTNSPWCRRKGPARLRRTIIVARACRFTRVKQTNQPCCYSYRV